MKAQDQIIEIASRRSVTAQIIARKLNISTQSASANLRSLWNQGKLIKTDSRKTSTRGNRIGWAGGYVEYIAK